MKFNKLVLALGAASVLFTGSVWAEQLQISVVAKGFQHQFWKAVEQGTQQAASEFNVAVDFQGPDSESNIAQQVEYMNDAVTSSPDAICLAALDTRALLDSIQMAKDEDIPIIGFDSGVPDAPEGAIKATAATDNYSAGAYAASKLLELIDGKINTASNQSPARIGVIAQEANSPSIVGRTQGFIEAFSAMVGTDKVAVVGHNSFKIDNPSASVIVEVIIPEAVDMEMATTAADTLLHKKDLVAVYSSNEFATNALIKANEGLDVLGDKKIVAIGFDAGSTILEAMEAGVLSGALTQNPVQIGYHAVRLAVDAANGKPVDNIDTGALWYDRNNMNDPAISVCLYH